MDLTSDSLWKGDDEMLSKILGFIRHASEDSLEAYFSFVNRKGSTYAPTFREASQDYRAMLSSQSICWTKV
jgi:hypothetical protein